MSDTLVIQHECIVTERHCKTMPVHWVCSVCGRSIGLPCGWEYCPMCGSKIVGHDCEWHYKPEDER